MHPEWLNLVRAFLFPGFLAQRTNLRDNFLSAEVSRTVRNGSADLQNGSERFCRPRLCTEISPQLPNPPKKRSRAVPPVSHFQNLPKSRPVAPRAKATRERSQKNDKGKATSPPKSLNRQCKGMLSTREKVKLDVDYKRLEVSQLFVHGRRGPFQNLTCLENCSVESVLTKSYNCVVCIEISVWKYRLCRIIIAYGTSMCLFVQTLCIKVK